MIHHNHQIALAMQDDLFDFGQQIGQIIDKPRMLDENELEFEVSTGAVPVLESREDSKSAWAELFHD